MQLLHERVNIVPVIGKSDTLTKKELQQIKVKVSVLLNFNLNATNFGKLTKVEPFIQC